MIRRLMRALAWLYLLGLVATVLVLRYVGEEWWITQVALYLPRAPFALPLVIFVPVCLLQRAWRCLAGQGVAALLWLFPLMGLVPPRLHDPAPGDKPGIRVMSYNVWFGKRGNDPIWEVVQAASPDVVAVQAASNRTNPFLNARYAERGFHVHQTTQFYLASRYPLRDIEVPGDLRGPGERVIGSNYVKYTIDTPQGPMDLFNMHPASPREGLEGLRGDGLLVTIQRGEAPDERQQALVERNGEIRRMQIEALVLAVKRAKNPVLIVGDTNLPGLSRFYERYFDRFRDGFAEAGMGLGYTFPAQKWVPWMRIDRMLAGTGDGPAWRFLKFSVGGRQGSDHTPVIAEVVLR